MEDQCHFILASHSPRRKNLLKLLGFPFKVIPSGVEDNTARTRSPSEFVENNSLVKATAVADKYREKWVLGADTVVVLESDMLGKPADEEEAMKMLLQLSGKTHRVFTGVSLVSSGKGLSTLFPRGGAGICRHRGAGGQGRCIRRPGCRKRFDRYD
jgi:septum formation protein